MLGWWDGSDEELAALRYGLEMAEGVYATFGGRADIIGALA